MAEKNVKKRYWAFVLYPESAPPDWLDRLKQTGLRCAISPLHDKDLDPTGTPKKAHRHVLMCYDGPTTFNAVKTLVDGFNAPIPVPLESVKGYYRYLTHMDNPEKYQYDEKDVITLNGFNIADFTELTKSEVMKIKVELQQLIRDLDLYEYSDFMDYLLDNDMLTQYDIASNHTFFFEKYISSRRNKLKEIMRCNDVQG